ncbi:hypothetical protein [Wolbachia endosymbiont (group E) of Neria commutata]|uniref:WD0745 family porin n=1 Tax=Wolbachia endosymbiont (group E) of Neria commutata TaxID=3066149 RepID=UPI003133428B
MKKSTYTRTALASLLTLCSFSGGFAADLPSEGMREIKKQESTKTSGKPEFTNKKLKEKMDRICNAVPRKKAEDAKQVAEQKKKDEMKLAAEKKKKEEEMRLANEKIKNDKAKDSKANAKNGKDLKNDPKTEKAVNAKDSKAKDSKIETKNIKPVTNKNIEDKSKAKAIEVRKSGATDLSLETKSGLRITFGGVVDAHGHVKAGPDEPGYRRYNLMAGGPKKYTNYYDVDSDKIKGANPIFPQGIGNVGDYSNNGGTVADAILHLRAENKNEDLGLLYGADVQFHVPVTEGKGASQGVGAARSRGAHIFVNSEYGDVKLGYQFGPESLMRLDATRIATVDGGADSDWYRKVNLEGSSGSFPFYVTPRLWTESFSSESEKLSFRMAGKYNKGVMTTLPFRVAYYSPNYMGARFGISYAPRYDSSLFSVSDNIAASGSSSGNPYADEIESITKAYVENGKLTLSPIAVGGKTYSTIDAGTIEAIVTAAQARGADNSPLDAFGDATALTATEKENVIKEVFAVVNSKIANPNFANAKPVTEILAKYKDVTVTDVDAAAKAVKPANEGAFVIAIKGSDNFFTGNTGSTNAAATKIATAVNALLAPKDKATVKAAVETAFEKPAFTAIMKDLAGGAVSQHRHVGPDYEHIFSAGVHYEYDFDEYKLKVKAAAVGEWGQPKQPDENKHIYDEYIEYEKLLGANLGVRADYKIDDKQSAKFAASFAYLGKSGQPKGIKKLDASGTKYEPVSSSGISPDNLRAKGIQDQFVGDKKDTMHWTVGAGYQRENIYTSLTYFGSKMNDGDKLHHIALGVQYDLSPACSKSKFIPYATLQYFMTEETGGIKLGGAAVPPNKGAILLTGVKFSF